MQSADDSLKYRSQSMYENVSYDPRADGRESGFELFGKVACFGK